MKILFRVALVCLAIAAGCIPHPLQAQVGANLPFIQPEFFSSGGNLPCGGCLLYSYNAGTTTPRATYSDSGLTTPNPNPLVLDSTGRPTGGNGIFMAAQSYKFVLKTSGGATIWSRDNIYDYGQLYGGVSGSGTTDFLPIFTSSTALGNSSISHASLGLPGNGLLLNDKVLIGASTATTTDAFSGALFVNGGITAANNTANAQILKLYSLSGGAVIESAHTGTATDASLTLQEGGTPELVINPGSLSTGGNKMVWNPPFDGFANTIDVGLFSTPEDFKGTKFLVQVYTTNTDPAAAHTAIDGSVDYRVADGSSGVTGGVLGHVALDPQTGTNITSSIGAVGAAGIAYTLLQPSNAQVNITGNMVGVNGRVTQYASGTISTAYAISTNGPVVEGSGIIDHAYGIGILDTGTTFSTGHTNHAVGLWIENIIAGTVDNFAIASDGGNSYHVGNFMIGTQFGTPPGASKLGVKGQSQLVATFDSHNGNVEVDFDSSDTVLRGHIFGSGLQFGMFSDVTGGNVSMLDAPACGLTGKCVQLSTGGVNDFIVDDTNSITATGIFIPYHGSAVQVFVGAVDSCTAGFRCLRIAN